MNRILSILQRKSPIDAVVSLVYFVIVGFLKWRLVPTESSLFFFIGAVAGIYFLEIAEDLFHLYPSPFRSVVFASGLAIVTLFVVTSTTSELGAGLVLSLSLTLLLWQIHTWEGTGNLNQWYVMIAGSVQKNIQQALFIGFIILFLTETFLFLR